ncbi:MAG: type II secretion system F family protein [Deltaproteobacteria bacterium]
MRFYISGINRKGEYVKQEFEAESEAEVIERLESDDFIIESIKQNKGGFLFFKTKKFSNRDLMFFCNSMAHMLGAGLDLIASLEVAERQTKGSFKSIIQVIHKDIVAGASLSESIARYAEFPEIFSKIIAVGERTGNYSECFESLYEYFSNKGQLEKKIKSVTAYPIMLLVFGVIITIVITVVAIPKMLPVVQNFDIKLNPLTQTLLNFSNFITQYYLPVIIVLTACFFGIKNLLKGPLSPYVDKAKFKLPILGEIFKKVTSVDFANTMAILDQAAVNLLIEIDLMADMFANKFVKDNILLIKSEVIKGEQISTYMSREIFDELLINVMVVGEKSGQKVDMLKKVANFLDQEVRQSIDSAVRILNPLLLATLGGVVGILIFSVMAPLLDIYKNVG